MPSTLSRRSRNIPPALLTRTSRRECRPRNSSARRRTSACDERSARKNSTDGLSASRRIRSTVVSPFSRSLPTTPTAAPRRVSASAVTAPIPEVAPVTRQTLPSMARSAPTTINASPPGPNRGFGPDTQAVDDESAPLGPPSRAFTKKHHSYHKEGGIVRENIFRGGSPQPPQTPPRRSTRRPPRLDRREPEQRLDFLAGP